MARSGSHNVPGKLGRRLRQLRSDRGITQGALASALGVAVSSISSWESGAKTPTHERLAQYARFFGAAATERNRLQRELERLHPAAGSPAPSPGATANDFWTFPDGGPVRIVCGKLAASDRPPYASAGDYNYMELSAYDDLDAMVQLYGHIRMQNPGVNVRYRLAPRMESDDLQAHLVLLGGVALEQSMSLFAALLDLPFQQVKDPEVTAEGEIFEVAGEPKRRFAPQFTEPEEQLVEDVGLLARVPSPFNINRTLTVCSGVFTRGVFGAVRSLTDSSTRDRNFDYLTKRFGDASKFGLLMRVPVVDHATTTPDLNNPRHRLYEWDGDS